MNITERASLSLVFAGFAGFANAFQLPGKWDLFDVAFVILMLCVGLVITCPDD